MIAHIESERSVLGSAFRSVKAAQEITERLRPDDFADPAHREIFAAVLAVMLGQRRVDLTTVDAELEQRGKLDAVGGAAYLIELSQSVPSAANVGAYIDIVLEKANLRRLQAIAESINRKTTGENMSADEIIERIESACNDITMRNSQRDGGWITGADAALMAYESIEQERKCIPTGFSGLDDKLCGGLVKPELTIVGARPGKGKSAFLLTASMAAARAGYHVGYFSFEMSAEQIGQRELAATSLVGISKQRRGKSSLSDKDWDALCAALAQLGQDGIGEHLHIYRGYTMAVERLANIARHAVDRGECDLLVIDYIQLLKTVEKTRSDFERIGIVSKSLKQLALTLNVPILTAAQVRRQSQDDTRKGGRAPTLDELRGSGDLEQDADNVLLIHSPESPDDPSLSGPMLPDENKGIWERSINAFASPFMVKVAKQRQGPTGVSWYLFKPSNMRFYEDGRN